MYDDSFGSNLTFGSGGLTDGESESQRSPRRLKAYFMRMAMRSNTYTTQMRFFALALEQELPKKPEAPTNTDIIAS